jgi:acyl-CoA synthetase (NDP forming)
LELGQQDYLELQKARIDEEIIKLEGDTEAVRALIDAAQAEGRDLLLHEAIAVLSHYGIAVAESIPASTVEAAQYAADRIGYPVAIKVVSESVSHKSDVGGVRMDLHDGAAVAQAFREMTARIQEASPEADIDGVLVQPMVVGGHELILGGRQDAQFGPVVLVGIGGVFVEIFEEVSLRVAPIARREALAMIMELRAAPILTGIRGHEHYDIEAVVDALLRLSQLLQDFPEIQDIDVNPLRVFPEGEGCLALDARVAL